MGIHFDYTVQDANRLLGGLFFLELGIVAIFALDVALGSPIKTVHILFDLDGEANVPAWFSSMQLFAIGLIFLVRGRQVSADDRPSRAFVLLVGTAFVFLSLDEVASIHEATTHVLKRFEAIPRFKGDHGIWIVIYPVIGLALIFATYRDLVAMWVRYRCACVIMAIGAAIILAGAVGLEIMGYQYLRGGSTPLLYQAEVALEEFLEMFGGSVILYGAALLPLNKSNQLP